MGAGIRGSAGQQTRDLSADPANQVLCGVVSFWEIAIEARIGKLLAKPADISTAATNANFDILAISVAHLTALKALPDHHHDPIDHLLIAQAMVENADFVTDDRHIARYGIRLVACAPQN